MGMKIKITQYVKMINNGMCEFSTFQATYDNLPADKIQSFERLFCFKQNLRFAPWCFGPPSVNSLAPGRS